MIMNCNYEELVIDAIPMVTHVVVHLQKNVALCLTIELTGCGMSSDVFTCEPQVAKKKYNNFLRLKRELDQSEQGLKRSNERSKMVDSIMRLSSALSFAIIVQVQRREA